MSATPAETGMIALGESRIADENDLVGYSGDGRCDGASPPLGAGARLRSGTVVYAGARVGANLETGHNVVIREDNVIGDEFRIWNNSTVDYGCRIGNRVKVHCNVYVAQFTVLEDDVFLAPGVTIANDFHPGCPAGKQCMRGPTIKRGARIGAGAVILPHVTIGEYALVGAGSVVTTDVPARCLVRGSPARVIGPISEPKCKTGLVDSPYGECDADTLP